MRRAAARPRSVLALFGLAALLAGWGAAGLRVDTDSSRMLSPDLPFQQSAHALNAAFPDLKNTIVILVRAPRADPADAATAALVDDLRGRAGIERVFAPAVDPFFLRHGLLYLERQTLEDRLTRLTKSANMLASLREDRTLPGFLGAVDSATRLAAREGADPAGLTPFLSEAAAVFEAAAGGERRAFAWTGALDPGSGATVTRAISITPDLDFARLSPAKAAIASARAAIEGLDPALAGPVEIGLTGEPVLRSEELASVAATLPVSLGLSLALVALVLWLALGTAGRAGLALAALALTLLLTAGVAGAAIGALNLISVAFVVLMTGLGIDFAIHLMAHLDEDARGAPPMAALWATGAGLGPALALGAATTSAAFFAFAATDFIGMAQLGVIGGAGVLIAFAVTLTLIPAAVALRPGLARGAPRGPALALPAAERGRALPLAALALGLAAAVLAPSARFDADPMGLRDPAAPAVRAYDWLRADPALAPLRLSAMASDAAEAEALAARLAALPEVRSARWVGDLVPADQAAKLALIDLAWPSLDYAVNGEAVALSATRTVTPAELAAELRGQGPAADRLAAALERYAALADPARDARLEADLFRHFPALIDRLSAQLEVEAVSRADLPAGLRARYVAPDGRLRVEILPAADIAEPAARDAFVDAVARVAPRAGGPPAQIAGAADTVAGAMLEAVGIALVAAAGLAWAVLRRALLVAAILVPLALGGAVTMAASVALGIPFNYANIIVLPLMIGIGVDSGVHLALRALRSGAVSGTSTPRAVAYSALTTIGAFATLALSDHRGTASMGVMLAIALVATVAMAFALTPMLVRLAQARASA